MIHSTVGKGKDPSWFIKSLRNFLFGHSICPNRISFKIIYIPQNFQQTPLKIGNIYLPQSSEKAFMSSSPIQF